MIIGYLVLKLIKMLKLFFFTIKKKVQRRFWKRKTEPICLIKVYEIKIILLAFQRCNSYVHPFHIHRTMNFFVWGNLRFGTKFTVNCIKMASHFSLSCQTVSRHKSLQIQHQIEYNNCLIPRTTFVRPTHKLWSNF